MRWCARSSRGVSPSDHPRPSRPCRRRPPRCQRHFPGVLPRGVRSGGPCVWFRGLGLPGRGVGPRDCPAVGVGSERRASGRPCRALRCPLCSPPGYRLYPPPLGQGRLPRWDGSGGWRRVRRGDRNPSRWSRAVADEELGLGRFADRSVPTDCAPHGSLFESRPVGFGRRCPVRFRV